MTVSAANIHPSVTVKWRSDRDAAPPPPIPPQNSESRLAKRSAAAKNKVQSTSAKTVPKMANGGVQKKSQENVGGAKNPSDIRTDDLLDLDVSNCHIYIVAKVWEHSIGLYINECDRNKALCCFFPASDSK